MPARRRRHSCRVCYYDMVGLGRPEPVPRRSPAHRRQRSHLRPAYFHHALIVGSFALHLHRYDVNKYFQISLVKPSYKSIRARPAPIGCMYGFQSTVSAETRAQEAPRCPRGGGVTRAESGTIISLARDGRRRSHVAPPRTGDKGRIPVTLILGTGLVCWGTPQVPCK